VETVGYTTAPSMELSAAPAHCCMIAAKTLLHEEVNVLSRCFPRREWSKLPATQSLACALLRLGFISSIRSLSSIIEGEAAMRHARSIVCVLSPSRTVWPPVSIVPSLERYGVGSHLATPNMTAGGVNQADVLREVVKPPSEPSCDRVFLRPSNFHHIFMSLRCSH
jgi:hypothetical protein